MKKVTLTDVAEAAGVSMSAVSRYINANGYLSEDKRLAIKKAIDELGYSITEPKKRDTHLIALITPGEATHVFYPKVWSSVANAAQLVSKSLVLITVAFLNNTTLIDAVERAMGHAPEGIIVAGFSGDLNPKNEKMLLSLPVPVVMFERNGNSKRINSVTFDEESAIEEAVDFLVSMGHTRIGYIGMIDNQQIEKQRYRSFLNTMQKHNLETCESRIALLTAYTSENGRHAMQQLLSEEEPVSAVVISADDMATGAVQAITENKKRIPHDISIIGHDDTYARFCSPKLTTIAYPMEEAAAVAINMIMNQFGTTSVHPPVFTKLGLTLVSGNSVKRL